MSILSFLKRYITKPRTVGAVAPSSRYLARKMMHSIDFATASVIAEFGAGTGVFTEEIIKKRAQGTLMLVFETDEQFFDILVKKYSNQPDCHIINDSAAQVGKYLEMHGHTHADYIVSGLPFASLPPQVSRSILSGAREHLAAGGRFITFQYTLLKKDFIGEYFSDITITREVRNIPPAYVLSCTNGPR